MQKLLQLIEKLYGKTALSKTLGTRTNVITLSDNETKRFIKDELNIEAASDTAALAAKNRAEKLIADIPKMNDQEILTFTNNLQRLDNKLNPPSAEVLDFSTKKPVSKEGIEQLGVDFGLPEGVDEGSIMGQLTRSAQRLREQAKTVPGIQEGEKLQTGVMRSAVRYKMLDDLEKGILKVSEEEAAIIKGEAKGDPLDLWLDNYGPDAMEAIQEMEPALRRGTTPKDLLLTIEKNVDARPLTAAEKLEMKANTREAGRVMQDYKDRVKGVSKKELKQKDPEMYDLLYGEGDPEEFAKGGRVGYQDGGPTKDEYGIMSLPAAPNDPDSVNDDIDRVAQLVAQSYKMSPEAQMNNKQIAYDRIEEIAEQISYGGNIDGVRSNLMDYFNDKVQEYQSMIQEFSTGGRVGFAGGGAKKGVESLIEMLNKKFGKGTAKKGSELERPEGAKVKQMIDDFMERNPDPNKQMTDEEIEQFVDDYGINPTDEYYTFDGTLGDAMRIVKEQKEYEDYMYDQYITGKLDPKAGDDTEDRMKFLRRRAEEMEATGDRRLMSEDDMDELSELEAKYLKDVDEAYGVDTKLRKELNEMKELGASKTAERFELKQKYPGIDDNLITFIVDDPNPQRKAEVLATLDQAFELMKRGKSPDEILSILKNITNRTEQASGGLSYLSGF
jgi:hypothetical protein